MLSSRWPWRCRPQVEPFGRLLMARERHFASGGVQGETSDLSERCWGDEHQHCTASAEGGHSPISEAHEPVANHVYGRFTCGLWTTPAEVHTPCGSHASATRQGRAYPATNERARRWVWVPSLKRSPSGSALLNSSRRLRGGGGFMVSIHSPAGGPSSGRRFVLHWASGAVPFPFSNHILGPAPRAPCEQRTK